MSIENEIEALTVAVNKLTAALIALTAAVSAQPVTEEVQKPGKSSTTTAAKVEKPAAQPETVSSPNGATPPATVETAAPAADTATSEPIPFKTLADAAIQLNNKDYNKLAAICKDEKVAKISALAQERYADVLARINEELEG